MSDQEFVLAIIAITMGCGVLIVGITKITELIKTWVGNNSEVDEESFNRLAKAFMQHKKRMEERMQNIEAVIAEDTDHSFAEIEAPKNEESLTNDLNKKDKARS